MSAGRRRLVSPRLAGVFRRLLQNRQFVLGASIVLAIVAIAVLAPWLTSVSPDAMNTRARMLPPSAELPLGSDRFGRDMLARVMYGARLSIVIGAATVLLTGFVGATIGCLAGFYRRLDNPLMRLMDALMAFPSILLAIAITAALGPSEVNVVIALAVVYTPRTARIMRATVLVQRELEYVTAAIAAGARNGRVLWVHILPNSLAPLIVQLSFIFAYAVLSEAVLSFLGLGPPPPSTSWGSIIAEGRSFIREAWWITFFPGLAITMMALGLNLAGDGLRDVLDPRLRVQHA